MTPQPFRELLDDLIGQVRQTRNGFEPMVITSERVWDRRTAPFGGITLESLGFVGYLAIRRGQPPVGYPIPADLEAAVLSGDSVAAARAGGVPALALIGFMALAAERLNAEEAASRPVA